MPDIGCLLGADEVTDRDWHDCTLEEVVADQPNAMCIGPFGSDLLASDLVEQGVPVVFVRNVRPGRFDARDMRYVTAAKAEKLRAHTVRPGDVVITKMGLPPGIAAAYPSDGPNGIVTADIIKLTPDGRRVDTRYLVHFLNSPGARAQVARFTFGVTRPKVTLKEFRTLRLQLPPLEEQRRIADILDKADAIRRKRKEAIALTEELLRSAFLEMFGSALAAVEEGSLPTGWRRAKVDQLKASGPYTCVGGPFGSNLTSADYTFEGVPVIRGTNLGAKTNTFIDDGFVFVSEGKAKELVQNMAYPGDLIFTQRGTLGQVALLPESARHPRYVISQSQMKLTPDTTVINTLYLHQFFCTARMQQYIRAHALTTGVPHINLGILRAIPVIVPPKSEQERFARLASEIGALRSRLLPTASSLDSLFAALVHRAFHGELACASGTTKTQLALFKQLDDIA